MTTVRDLFAGEPSLVPGALRGYRTWRGLDPEGRLISTGVLHRWALTPFGGASEHADCHSFPAGAHPAPHADCTCGLYGWYDPADSRIPLGGCTGPIFGVVQATGRVILGAHGFRAERLEVVAITSENDTMRWLLRELGYPVHDSREDMLVAFPPEDISGLVQHECDGQCVRRAAGAPGRVPRLTFVGVDLSHFVVAFQQVQQVAASTGHHLTQLAAAVHSEAKAEEERRRQRDLREHALKQRRNQGTGPVAPSLFRAALQRRGGGRG